MTRGSIDPYKDNKIMSKFNMDNYPTHEHNGETYCSASKHYSKVDPSINDPKHFHHASLYSTYLLLKNRHTGQWEFPKAEFKFGKTFRYGRQEFFRTLADGWSVQHISNSPVVHTIKDLPED